MKYLQVIDTECNYLGQRYKVSLQLKSRDEPEIISATMSAINMVNDSVNYDRVNLNCPISQKNTCKDLGGLWDPAAKTWYVLLDPDTGLSSRMSQPLAAFKQWLKPQTAGISKMSAMKKVAPVPPKYDDEVEESDDAESTVKAYEKSRLTKRRTLTVDSDEEDEDADSLADSVNEDVIVSKSPPASIKPLAKMHRISDESDEEEESVTDTKSPPVPRPTFKKNRHVIAESDEEVEVAQSHTVQHDEDMMITKSPTVSKINGGYPSIKRISASRQSGKKRQHHIKNDSPSEESPNKKIRLEQVDTTIDRDSSDSMDDFIVEDDMTPEETSILQKEIGQLGQKCYGCISTEVANVCGVDTCSKNLCLLHQEPCKVCKKFYCGYHSKARKHECSVEI